MSHQSEEEQSRSRGPASSDNVRDHLANQRTLLSWVRTGLALIGLGFVVSRFGLLLREEAPSHNLPHYSSIIGAIMSIFGAIITLLAFWLFVRVRRSIEVRRFHPSFFPESLLVLLVVLIGIFLFFYLMLVE